MTYALRASGYVVGWPVSFMLGQRLEHYGNASETSTCADSQIKILTDCTDQVHSGEELWIKYLIRVNLKIGFQSFPD